MSANHEPNQQLSQHNEQLEAKASPVHWEYKVIHININVENSSKAQASTPEKDSKRLQGALSPEFIKREFPKMYMQNARKSTHPAEQLEMFLNSLGKESWELIEISQVGELLMFFFKRLLTIKTAIKKDSNRST
jgi:hypothetical protein